MTKSKSNLGGALCNLFFGVLTAWDFLYLEQKIFPFSLVGIGLFYWYFCCPGNQTSIAHAARMGFMYGMGFFTASLYWISYSFQTDLERFFWLIPIAVLGIPAVLSLATACTAVCARAFSSPVSLLHPWVFAAWWVICEWLRGHFLGGFPWNLIGYAAIDISLSFGQIAAYVGVYGLSYLIIGNVAAVTYGIMTFSKDWRKSVASLFLAFLCMGICFGFGEMRLGRLPITLTGVRLKLIQTHISQHKKWSIPEIEKNFLLQCFLSQQNTSTPAPHMIIWPEAACSWYPDYLQNDQARLKKLGALLAQGSFLITGTPRAEVNEQGVHLYNSLFVINSAGDIVAQGDKFHLAPFGEYLPFRAFLESLTHLEIKKITAGERDFTPGRGPRTLNIGRLPPLSPLICYEVIFPHAVVHSQARPEWLLNLTNDAWFGDSPGPYQHFAIARMRSIEEGLPLVRVANAGISAIVDACGRILKSSPLTEESVIEGLLPKALPEETFYERWGDAFILSLCFIVVSLGLLSRRFSKK